MATTKATTKATAAKSKKRVRKYEKQYRFRTFESSIFEGEFKLPEFKQMPGEYGSLVRTGNMNGLYDWLAEVGVIAEDIEAIKSLDSEELEIFFKEWDSGELGK
jgi:hypothetical protein|nr:MAG TPA: hypothetical protein [Caudoviricetes sp.]